MARPEDDVDDGDFNVPLDDASKYIRSLYVNAVRKFNLRRTGFHSNYGMRPIPEWDGGKAKDGAYRQPIWPKLVKFYVKYDIAPEVAIEGMFRYALTAGARQHPSPLAVYGDKVVAVYERLRNDMVREKVAELRSCETCLSSEAYNQQLFFKMEEKEAINYVLQSTLYPMNPLFRYAMALKHGFGELADKLKLAASSEYLWNHDVFGDEWKALLPSEFEAEILERRKAILRGVK